MKFGERLEQASVPSWSLHNVDYNSLKYQIKVHTTKDQATAAVTIPGQQDYALQRFEDDFYHELCSQHDRVGLFVTSKADEISRRLRHLCGLVHQLLLKCTDTCGLSAKRQRRFVKYQTQVDGCGQDVKALSRFVDAQVTAFRKILKKHKKWTGSTTLSSRFKDDVIGNPKSFTHYNFAPLQLQYRELRTTLEAALPVNANLQEPPLPTESPDHSDRKTRRNSRQSSSSTAPATPSAYWNEYEHGSDAGDQDDAYVIYVDPNADDNFPGFEYVKNMLGTPVGQVRHWLQSQKSKDPAAASSSETQSLLDPRLSNTTTSPTDYFSISGRHTAAVTPYREPTTEDEYMSSEEGEPYHPRSVGFFPRYSHSSSSSIVDPKTGGHQDRVLTQSIVLAFVAAFMLLGVSALLVMTGRRRLRLEVDAGATLGSVASLFCACMGLGAMLYRQCPAGYLYSLAVWGSFIAVCALNGILLVLIVSSSGF
ncbi:putative spx domain-containing protein [Rosellinia necatrix]|uniref:Putative spx domain-containing protein n=1 Tax=Rosellinia necatrix TaxID=77044 RepID=A0A1W2TCW0_ROSNE|nr:putative spx domain-containing protein [Rosellinia necatrix]